MSRSACLAFALAASVVLAACGTVSFSVRSEAPDASVLRIAIGVDVDTLDPKRQTTTTVFNIVQMMVESLVWLDQNGRLQPRLATSWQEAPDATSWLFTLRDGVRFSDGARLDAAAVQLSLDRTLDPSGGCPMCGPLSAAVRSVDVVDSSHVRLSMKQPLASDVVLGLLSEPTFGIMSPLALERAAPAFSPEEHPVGTGPYILEERVRGDHLTLLRNRTYWGERPTYNRQVLEIVPDAARREAMVRSGEAQVSLLPPISDLPSLLDDENVKVSLARGDRSVFFAIDTVDERQSPLRNAEVRRALNHAVNRDAIVRSTLFGAADPATSAMAPSVFGYCAQPPYDYDPELARSMLAKANVSGLTIKLIAPTGRYIQDFQAAQNVAGALRAVGVDVQGPETMDWPTYVRTILVPPARASVDAHMLGFAPAVLDGSQAMMMFDPGQMPPVGLATSYYDNPTVTALLTKAQLEVDRDVRAQEYCEVQRRVWDDAPWIFLWFEKFPIVHSSRVTGVESIPNESFYTVYARPV